MVLLQIAEMAGENNVVLLQLLHFMNCERYSASHPNSLSFILILPVENVEVAVVNLIFILLASYLWSSMFA